MLSLQNLLETISTYPTQILEDPDILSTLRETNATLHEVARIVGNHEVAAGNLSQQMKWAFRKTQVQNMRRRLKIHASNIGLWLNLEAM